MEGEQQPLSNPPNPVDAGHVEMPAATAAPLVLAAGLVLLAGGVVLGVAMSIVGGVLLFVGLGQWIASLLPGRGHFHEPLVAADERPAAIRGAVGAVERLATGKPGYRVQMPEKVHPISAGVKGGLLGGLVMPAPALLWGLSSGHGPWLPINLLAGMALPGIQSLSVADLEKFNLTYLIAASFIHVATSLTAGLAYGVLLPMLPAIPKPLAWSGLLMPLLWTAASFVAMQQVNPALHQEIDWPSFIFSQFIFGVVVASVVMRFAGRGGLRAGLWAGAVGGILMVIPAAAWGLLSGHSIWYPANVLAAMIDSKIGALPVAELQVYHLDWLASAIAVHAAVSLLFGGAFGLLLPMLPRIPGPMSWGVLLMPLVWTGMSYGLMDVVNPVLEKKIQWPWFIVSQFVFGIVASIVVVRSEQIHLPPVGRGPAAE